MALLRPNFTRTHTHTSHVDVWNVRTLLNNKSNPERRSAIIAHELQKYNIDIAALSETRVHGNSQFEEAAAGCTFFLTRHPTDGPSQAGVVLPFAPHSSNALNRGLLPATRELCHRHSTILLPMLSQSCLHAPTLVTPADVKNEF